MKYAVITGGSRGIGKAISIQLSKDGFTPLIIYKDNEIAANEVKKQIKHDTNIDALLFKVDLSNLEQIKQFANALNKITDNIDLLINNVAITQYFNLEETTDEEIESVLNVVLKSKILMTKYMLPFLKRSQKASVVNIASRMGAEKTIEGISIYGSSEAGVIKFSKCCALEFAKYKIRVNSISPGLTNTDMTKDWIEELGGKDKVGLSNPSGRIGEPQDIANVVSFLVSEKGEYINGENVGVNGGSNLG